MEQGAKSEHAQAGQDIVISIEIEAPLERIWEAIATQERLRDWFNAEMRFEPRVGGAGGVRRTARRGAVPLRRRVTNSSRPAA